MVLISNHDTGQMRGECRPSIWSGENTSGLWICGRTSVGFQRILTRETVQLQNHKGRGYKHGMEVTKTHSNIGKCNRDRT